MKDKSKPNILLFVTDTQRCDTLNCMGYPFAISPNTDRLAKEGVMFTQAHTASPVCMPARCCLMTGTHTPINNSIENGMGVREDLPRFTDYLKEAGYYNMMIGKTHFGLMPESFDYPAIPAGEDRDFDSTAEYTEFINKMGFEFDVEHPNPIPEDDYLDSFLVNKTIEQIEIAQKIEDKPFFAFCSIPAPHSPLVPPGDWEKLYDDVELPPINYVDGELDNMPEHLKRLVGIESLESENEKLLAEGKLSAEQADVLTEARGRTIRGKDPKFIETYRKRYYGFAAYVDSLVGRIINYLDESGLRDNTLVIFTTDHGQQYFDHGFNDKHNWYDESWRIPFIMSMPGTLPSGETAKYAVWTDIPTTILAAAGTKADHMQGYDLFTPLKNGKDSPRDFAVGTLYKSVAVANDKYKLEYYLEESTGRLFDRINDPNEQNDLYNNLEFADIKNKMVQAVLTWRADISDVNFLIENLIPGGPVARRIATHTRQMKGIDPDLRLSKALQEI